MGVEEDAGRTSSSESGDLDLVETGVDTADTGVVLTLGVTATRFGPATGVATLCVSARGVEIGTLTFDVTGSEEAALGVSEGVETTAGDADVGVSGVAVVATEVSGEVSGGSSVGKGSTELSQTIASGSISCPVCSIKNH